MNQYRCDECGKPGGFWNGGVLHECGNCNRAIHRRCGRSSFIAKKLESFDLCRIFMCMDCKAAEEKLIAESSMATAVERVFDEGYDWGYRNGEDEGQRR